MSARMQPPTTNATGSPGCWMIPHTLLSPLFAEQPLITSGIHQSCLSYHCQQYLLCFL